jgi:hypothetical protein
MEFLYLDEDTVDVLRKKQMALTQEVCVCVTQDFTAE